MLTCAACGTENEAGRKFCAECGARLAVECGSCGASNLPGAKFCGECGTRLGSDIVADTSERAGVRTPGLVRAGAGDVPVDQLRLVSVVFLDLVGFTPLSERLDAEDVRELLSAYFEQARQIVDRYGGTIEKFIGDAVMAVWGAPVAHEDDAERAVRAALQLVEAVGRLEAGGDHLQARAGVLTGEAAVTLSGSEQGMVIGDLVNTTARLQSVAEPGAVLVGEATYRATSGAIAYETVGEASLKGKTLPVAGWRAVAIVARRGGEGRSVTLEPPFVGRDEELRTLTDQFHAAVREGKPRLVTIVGQAGIGKSRLGWELEKYLDGVVETILWHEGRSPSYGEGISYWALAEIVRGRAGIAESDDPDTARRRLGEMLDTIVPDPAERHWIEPRLTGLLGLDDLPVETREELFAAWRTFFERLASQATTLLVFWDLQWADQGLLDFIEHLLTWARSSPIFVLAEARPELFERRPGWGTTVRSAASIHLDPLAEPDMRRLLVGLVPGLPDHALRAIIDRAEGVPLYAVETLRMLIDRGVLVHEPESDRYVLAVALPELAVPDTLHALIAARLDSLAPGERSVLTDAAVLGLSFTIPSVVALSDASAETVGTHLDRLVRHQVLVLEADPRSPERGQYRFVQGVVREVAYQSLAKRDRRTKHVAAARYLESLGDDELAGVLASHYLAAYRATAAGPEADALAAQARVALRAAADRAAALHSLPGALGYLEEAIAVTTDPLEKAHMHERAAVVAGDAARMATSIDHAERAERTYAEHADRLGVLRSRTTQARTKLLEHGDKAAVEILERALADVSDLPDGREIALARSELARALMLSDSPDAIPWADKVLANPGLVSSDVLVETLITRATSLLNEGEHLIEAEVGIRGALAVADRLGDTWASLRARNNLLGFVGRVDLEEQLLIVRETYDIAQRYGQRTWVQQAVGSGLATSFDVGRWDDWVAEADEEEPLAAEFYRHWFRTERARRVAYRGDTAEANRVIAEAMAADAIRGSGQAIASMSQTTGEIRMLEGRWIEAFEIGRSTNDLNENISESLALAMFAATAAGDLDRLREVIDDGASRLRGDWPVIVSVRQVGDTFAALLEGRWDDARRTFGLASRTIEATHNARVLALFGMAVGHLAHDRFAEAADALRDAEAFFAERGAGAVVAAYRANAAGVPPVVRPSGQSAGQPVGTRDGARS